MKPVLYILAGANGSGKSTVSKEFLPAEGIAYVNPDDIAMDMNPSCPERVRVSAGRETLRRIDDCIRNANSFAIESTLSGQAYARTISRARRAGYKIAIIYVFVDSPEVCIARIAARVLRGGHNVPDEDVRRRYWKSKRNFWNVYAPMSDYWVLLYNGESQVAMAAKKDGDGGLAVFSEPLLELFKEGI